MVGKYEYVEWKQHMWSVNKLMRLPVYRTIWQHCRLALQVKGK